MENIEIILFFTGGGVHDGLAGDFADGQCGTAASITIEFGEHDTGEVDAVAEGFSGSHGILANHGVNNKEHFIRVNGIANVASLRHQCLVNAQTTSSIHDHHIVLGAFCFLNAAARHINGIAVGGAHVVVVGVNRSARVRRKAGHSGAFRHNLQLLDSTWSLQVTGHKHGGVPLPGKVLG